MSRRYGVTIAEQCGSSSAEYILATTVVSLAILAPIPGLEHSVASLLLHALSRFQNSSINLLSLP